MNSNQNQPVASFAHANPSTPLPAEATPKPGEGDKRVAGGVAAEIFPEAAKGRQTPPAQAGNEIEILPEAAKGRQTPPSDLSAATNEPADRVDRNSPIFRRADDLLVAEIAGGTSLAEAARRAGVSERTAQRRWQEQDFQDKVLAMRANIRCEVVGRMSQQAKQALAVLFQGMSAKSESVRVAAARSILKLGQEMGGRAEENALLARQVKNLQDALDQVMGNQQQ